MFCILFSDNILFLIINITYCGKFAKYKKAQKHKEESFGYIIRMQCFNSLPAVSQLTHIVIVLPQTLVACFHFSTFLLYFALFFLCSAPIPSCTLPSLWSLQVWARAPPRAPLVPFTFWKTRRQLPFQLWYYSSGAQIAFQFLSLLLQALLETRCLIYRFYSLADFFL